MRITRHVICTTAGFALVACVLVAADHCLAGGVSKRTTYLTFARSVRLPSVTLKSGTYIFELADPGNIPGMVRVVSHDRKIGYFMGRTNLVERLRDLPADTSVSLGEAEAAAAPPITVWWPVGEDGGREFIYADR
jgi:hypothetical protein